MRVAAIALTILTAASYASPSVADQQSCATVVSGGTIPEGTYAGAGGDQEAALNNLREVLGVSEPDCGPCSGRGCVGSVAYEEGQILFGAPLWDPSTGNYVVVAVVEIGGALWDQVCTSCSITP